MTPRPLQRPTRRPLRAGWSLRRTPPGHWATPASCSVQGAGATLALDGIALPTTVASAAREAGILDPEDPDSLSAFGDPEASDWWVFGSFDASPQRHETLRFEGLSPGTTVWLNGAPILEAESFFHPHVVDVRGRLQRQNTLHLCHRSPSIRPTPRRPRARWRTGLVADRSLRFRRTPLIGRIQGQGPPLSPVGPWRPILLEEAAPADAPMLESAMLDARLEDGTGHLRVEILVRAPLVVSAASSEAPSVEYAIEVAGRSFPLRHVGRGEPERSSEDGRWVGEGVLSGVVPWWPHTHLAAGASPALHDVSLVRRQAGAVDRWPLERVGFRHLEVAPGERFALRLNGEAVFCRGTVWAPLDPIGLHEEESALRVALEQVRDAGLNMIRVPGTGVPASDAFLRICDALGILVWHDFPFATFDYPFADPDFAASVDREITTVLERVRSRACLAVLCGNNEGEQQPAMLGLEPEAWRTPFFERTLPARCAEVRDDVPYRTSTPSGGALPFQLQVGTTHYFGVGAYRRPLEDLRASRPAFASECLALANVPGLLGPDTTPTARHPRDRGADWDFMDVTRHYAETLFGDDLETADARRAAHMLRATSAWLMEQGIARLRTPEADCGGALVLCHRDGWSSAGWGMIDATSRPKAAWYGLARAAAPIAVSILDDGLDGLRVAVANDRPVAVAGQLEVALVRRDGVVVERAGHAIELAPRGRLDASVDALIGGFRDSSRAYRFGERAFDAAVASFEIAGAETGMSGPPPAVFLLADQGALAGEDLGWHARWLEPPRAAGGAVLELVSERLATWVVVDAPGAVPSDAFFHLVPRSPRRIALHGMRVGATEPVRVSALNAGAPIVLHPLPATPTPETAS